MWRKSRQLQKSLFHRTASGKGKGTEQLAGSLAAIGDTDTRQDPWCKAINIFGLVATRSCKTGGLRCNNAICDHIHRDWEGSFYACQLADGFFPSSLFARQIVFTHARATSRFRKEPEMVLV